MTKTKPDDTRITEKYRARRGVPDRALRRATFVLQSLTMGSWPVKKGRHRRFEEARAMKRSSDIDFDSLLESLKSESGDPDSYDDDDLEDDDDR